MLFLKIMTVVLPWPLKRFILVKFFKYEIHPSAKIGFSWIYPQKLIMDANSQFGHFNVAIHLDKIIIGVIGGDGIGPAITAQARREF